MDELAYSYLTEFVKKLSFPEGADSADIVSMQGKLYSNDDCYKHFCRVLNSRVEKPSKEPCILNDQEKEKRINCEKKLTARISSVERFNLFVLIVQKCVDLKSGVPITGYQPQIERLAVVCDIEKADYMDVMAFFSSTEPYDDTVNSIYFAPEKSNRLVAAKGVNVNFSLKTENEIFYLKYFKKHEQFLIKTFSYHRPNNSITDNIKVKEVNYLNALNFPLLKQNVLSFESLVESVNNYSPFQSVNVDATPATPAIFLDAALCRIIIRGSSSPLSPMNYFQPVYDWVNNYETFGGAYLEVHFLFDYFNSYTSKFILNLTNMCKSLTLSGREVKCFWYYKEDDEEMKEFGKHLKGLFGKGFKLVLLDKSPEILV